MTFQSILTEQLHSITGGAESTQAAPPASSKSSDSIDDRVRDAVDEEMKLRDNERFRDWERSHPFSALICQGDRSCMR